jgi:UDP-glucose 4-epimerase
MRVDDLFSVLFEIAGRKKNVTYSDKGSSASHYGQTPYRYSPRSAKKIVPLEFVDLGQGLLEVIEEINFEMGANGT